MKHCPLCNGHGTISTPKNNLPCPKCGRVWYRTYTQAWKALIRPGIMESIDGGRQGYVVNQEPK